MLIKEPAREFDSPIAANARPKLKLDIENPIRLDGVKIRGVGYTATNTELVLSSVIDQIRILQDQEEKSVIVPALERKWEEFLNANADTLSANSCLVAFNRYLNPNSGWGVGNIGQLLLEVIMKNSFPANTACTALKATQMYHPIDSHMPRGPVYVTKPVNLPALPVAGWNTINDLPFYDVANITSMLFDSAAVTEVEIKRGGRTVYHQKKIDQLDDLKQNPLYKVPSTCTHTDVSGQAVTSTGPMPVILNDFGDTRDSLPVFEGKTRQVIKVRFYYDTTIAAAADFQIRVEGIESDAKEQGFNATARA